MIRSEFLKELRHALENDLTGSVVEENIEFYNHYIDDEVRKGKREEEVLQILGDPWILARTVIDVQSGNDKDVVYEAGRDNYTGHNNSSEQPQERRTQFHAFGLDTWWKKLFLILAIVMIFVVVFSIISGVISLLAPIVVPIIVIMIVVRVLGNRRR